jgi:hypothetical protein
LFHAFNVAARLMSNGSKAGTATGPPTCWRLPMEPPKVAVDKHDRLRDQLLDLAYFEAKLRGDRGIVHSVEEMAPIDGLHGMGQFRDCLPHAFAFRGTGTRHRKFLGRRAGCGPA